MTQHMIYIDEFEREIEFRLGRRSRVVLRAVIVLLTHAVLCLMVMASTRVVAIVTNCVFGGDLKTLGAGPFHFIGAGVSIADALTVVIFSISALVKTSGIMSHATVLTKAGCWRRLGRPR